MKIVNPTQSYTIFGDAIIDTNNGTNGHTDICNDIVAMALPEGASEQDFFDCLSYACGNQPRGCTFSIFAHLCAKFVEENL